MIACWDFYALTNPIHSQLDFSGRCYQQWISFLLCPIIFIFKSHFLLTMMQRWSRKRSHFPLAAFVLLVFLACSVLYNETSIPQIHEHPDHVSRKHETTVTYIKPNLASYSKRAPGTLYAIVSGDLCSLIFTLYFNLFIFSCFVWDFRIFG